MFDVLASITEQQFSEPEFAALPSGWAAFFSLVGLAALGYVVIWLYRAEARVGAGLRLRLGLAGLRCVVIVLLALVWIEPVIATYTVRAITAGIVVLTDVSESMSIADVDAGGGSAAPVRRIDRVQALLSADEYARLKRLAARNELHWYAFGGAVRRVPTPWLDAAGAAAPPAAGESLEPVDAETDLGDALRRALQDLADSPAAGVVVLSDGIFNAGMSAEAVAAYARRFRAPLYPVAVGSLREPANVQIASFTAPNTTAKGDPVELRLEVAAAGIEATPVRLRVTARRVDQAGASTPPREVATRDLTVGGDAPTAAVEITDNPDQGGEYLYTAEVEQTPGEALTLDNRRTAVLRVLDEQLRVLLIAGRPSYDYRFVTRLFERDPTIELSCWLQSADARAVRDGDTVITALPRQPEELFEYDVVLLIDPEPRELDSSWALTVRRLVDEFGGGVFLQAGPHFTSRFLRDPRLKELTALFPVRSDPDAEVRLSAQGAYRTRMWPAVIPDEAWEHPLLRLHPDPQTSRQIWSALPGVWWYLPVLREKPLATVLMRHGGASHSTRYGQSILLAAQPFGAGRSVFLAFDSTWRWRSTAEDYFNRFWVQLVRYLGHARREGASKRGTIVLDRDTINIGDFLKIEARVLGERFVPWHEPQIEAQIIEDQKPPRSFTLKAIPGREGWFAARLAIDWSGPGLIRVPLPGDQSSDDAAEALTKHIDVHRPNLEMQTLRRATEPLMRLAEQTGGRFTTIDRAAELPDWIQNASRERKTRGADQALWDNVWVMALIALLLGIEWAVRRRNHLL